MANEFKACGVGMVQLRHMTAANHSPWLDQLQRTRPLTPLAENAEADVAIVGAGIAGMMTAYFTLKLTTKSVIVIDASKVAHGATGHNAGQIVSYFERPFSEIIKEFGKERALAGLADVESGWDLLEQIYREVNIKTPLAQFTGYAGCTNVRQIIKHLKNNQYRIEGRLPVGPVLVEQSVVDKKLIPKEYDGMYAAASKKQISDVLETDDERYIAALGSRKGCANSALLTEELCVYLLREYPQRFRVFEDSPVRVVRLHEETAQLLSGQHVITCQRVVLCTNGFESLKIENVCGANINAEFHHIVQGAVGYMAAYQDTNNRTPAAISYFPLEESDGATGTVDALPYYYLTRRLHYSGNPNDPDLICIGGPEEVMQNTTHYHSKEHAFPDSAKIGINDFLHSSYRHTPKENIPFTFFWHGLMGYTPNGIRRVGPEPHNPVLLYNLGCNGIGLLPSIFGGKRIARFLNGEKLPPSIFDVHPASHNRHRSHHLLQAAVALLLLAVASCLYLIPALLNQ